jgi:HSP20 family molecular chaperone IbpA
MSLETRNTMKQQTESPDGIERVSARTVYRPPVDIVESETEVILVADMAGVNEASVDLTLEKNVLKITGSVNPPQFEGFHLAYSEYGVGDYERSFTVSDEIDRDGIEATVRDGVLRVKLPKLQKAVAKKISVRAGA